MPDKLTDNEIIKDFTEKTELIGSMSSVYLDEDKGLELYEAMRNALILINRLQAENDGLKAKIDKLKLEMSYMSSPNTIGDRHEMGCW